MIDPGLRGVVVVIERFSIKCRKAKTKVITPEKSPEWQT